MTNNLVPTPRTDRNGKTVIRHMRPEQQNAPQKAFPGVSLTTGQDTLGSVKSELLWVLSTNYKHGYHDTAVVKDVVRWVNNSTDQQLAELVAALKTVTTAETSFVPAVVREANVIRSILSSTLNDQVHHRHAHGMLAARAAFCSESATLEKTDMRIALPVYLGLVCNMHGKDLPEEEILEPQKLQAALRYAYETINARVSYDSTKVFTEIYVQAESGHRTTVSYSFVQYRDKKLLKLLTENVDRVDDIISLTRSHQTFDPTRLSVLMNYDGPQPLGSGAL